MLPARRTSKSVKRSRRAHQAIRPLNLSACPRCDAARLPHHACAKCGYVNSKVSIKVEAEEK